MTEVDASHIVGLLLRGLLDGFTIAVFRALIIASLRG
jgi:hypothetical protein